MTANTSRVLTCSHNRRRDLPQNPHDAESSMQTTKPKPSSSIRTMSENKEKLSIVSENVTEWRCLDKELSAPSLDSEDEEISIPRAPIFRQQQHASMGEMDDMLMLKRASPVFDDDEEEEEYISPPKRQRTSEPSQFHWEERLPEDEVGGFSLYRSFN
jgi:hypothetical protein